ncbi:MAG: hypothetical protein AAF206_08765 [Bacteroidota bacterium]
MNRPDIHIEQITQYEGHKGSIFAMVTDQAEQYLFTAGDDGMVVCWDLQNHQNEGEGVLRLGNSIYALCWIERYRILVAGGSEGSVHFLAFDERQLVHTWRKTGDAIYGLYDDPERDCLWILHAKGYLSVLRLTDFQQLGHQRLAQSHLRSFADLGEKNGVLIGSSDHTIRRLDVKSGSVIQEWKAHENSVFSLAVHPFGKYLLSGGRDAHLNVWDIQNDFAEIRNIPAHNFTINHIVFSPNADYFLTASRDKSMKLWDAWNFQLLKVIDAARFAAHTHSVNRLAWLVTDNSVISCGDDRRVIRWKLSIEPPQDV